MSILSVLVVIVFYGFRLNENLLNAIEIFLPIAFSFFVLNYFVKFFFTLHRSEFLVRNWFETLLVLLLLIDGITILFADEALVQTFFRIIKLENYPRVYQAFIMIYLVLFAFIEAGKLLQQVTRLRVKPGILLMLSFIALIAIGTGLLMLPEMTAAPGSMPFLEALFTSTSASCVTGLIVVDTATYFTLKGQIIIMLLFQAGGIGIITFGMFFALFSKGGVGLRHQTAAQNILDAASLSAARELLGRVVLLTFTIEIIGFLLIYSLWSADVDFSGNGERIFFSVFHSVSAFCNAGFSLFSNGMYEEAVRESYVQHMVIAVLIFFGALGFPAINDLISIRRLRDRMKYPWKKWTVNTRIALYTSLALVAVGAVFFFILEFNNTLAPHTYFGKIVGSIFQSVTTRTAGFNTLDIGALSGPVLIMFIFLMFIGASSASTGGGIKTSTFVIIFESVFSSLRGKKRVEIGKRTLYPELMYKAFSIFVFAVTFIVVAVFFLTITDPHIPIVQLVFEEVSAFCTVGLSTGITAELSTGGRIIIILSMYVGRIGILTLALALSGAVISTSYKYPRAHVMIG